VGSETGGAGASSPGSRPPSPTGSADRLFAVLGFGEIVMLTVAALVTITLLVYLNKALEHQPAVLTPTVVAAPVR
jgi:hypothetical protein